MGCKILVVDDSSFMRRFLRRMLAQGGYTEVEEAKDGEEALYQFKAQRPDLVLLDITMPGKPGMEVLAELLALDASAKVMICSALGQDALIAQAKRLGACGFLHKPFLQDELLNTVRRALPLE